MWILLLLHVDYASSLIATFLAKKFSNIIHLKVDLDELHVKINNNNLYNPALFNKKGIEKWKIEKEFISRLIINNSLYSLWLKIGLWCGGYSHFCVFEHGTIVDEVVGANNDE